MKHEDPDTHLRLRRRLLAGIAGGLGTLAWLPARALEQRGETGFLRGPYNLAFYRRHNPAYRIAAGMHFFHSKQHDLLEQTPLSDAVRYDALMDREATEALRQPPRLEPEMPYYSEYVDRAMHRLFRTIDWTHVHHEQTYDILACAQIPWSEKKAWTDRAVHHYLHAEQPGIARSCAPLDVTMRRAGVMTKPYFTYFRNRYPLSQSLFYVAHWWHPGIYEALMLSGNGPVQERRVQHQIGLVLGMLDDRPQRMILSRELMPRYARLSPESANIFDNLHMLHGITYDLLAYEGWSIDDKRKELYRVIEAMGYQPGDEALARKFSLPAPGQDPADYTAALKAPTGGMSQIMEEMMMEMMPMMMPNAKPDAHARMMKTAQQKMMLGQAPDEVPGSLHDALMRIMPTMQMPPGAMDPGSSNPQMMDAMLAGWRSRRGSMSDLPVIDMSREPVDTLEHVS